MAPQGGMIPAISSDFHRGSPKSGRGVKLPLESAATFWPFKGFDMSSNQIKKNIKI